MKCPRCATEMNEVEVNNIKVDLCPNCEGSWYDADELGQVMSVSREALQTSELSPILEEDRLDRIDVEQPLNCPKCGEAMLRYKYLITSEVTLDECHQHGIWLDDGELTKMFQFLQDWEEPDPELMAKMNTELTRLKMEAKEREEHFLNSLGGGLLGGRLIRKIYSLFSKRI